MSSQVIRLSCDAASEVFHLPLRFNTDSVNRCKAAHPQLDWTIAERGATDGLSTNSDFESLKKLATELSLQSASEGPLAQPSASAFDGGNGGKRPAQVDSTVPETEDADDPNFKPTAKRTRTFKKENASLSNGDMTDIVKSIRTEILIVKKEVLVLKDIVLRLDSRFDDFEAKNLTASNVQQAEKLRPTPLHLRNFLVEGKSEEDVLVEYDSRSFNAYLSKLGVEPLENEAASRTLFENLSSHGYVDVRMFPWIALRRKIFINEGSL